MSEDIEILRWLFPSRCVQCPHCGHVGHRRGGASRSGETRYIRCGRCGRSFILRAVACEILTAAGGIEVRAIRTYIPPGIQPRH